MHQQEVGAVVLGALNLRNTGSHRHGGNAGRTDQGVDLAAGHNIQQVAQQQAAHSRECESHQAQSNDTQSLHGQEVGSLCGCANGQAQPDGGDVAQCVLSNVAQTLHNAGLAEQVAQHQAAKQRSHRGQQQRAQQNHEDGEHNLLGLGNSAQLLHLDLTHFVGGQQLHDGGLDQGDQSHVRVCCNGDSGHQIGAQLGCSVNGGGAVGAADDTDGSSLGGAVQARQVSHDKGNVNAELSSSAQDQRDGVSQQGAKVSHGTHSQEHDAGEQLAGNASVVHHTQNAFAEGLGACAVLHQAGQGQVGQEHAERNGQQQKGLKLFHNRHVHQHKADNDHDRLLPGECCKAGLGQQTLHNREEIHETAS